MELMAHIINMNSFFVIRLKKDTYIGEREYMTSNDEILEIEINKDRINKFKDKILKEKFKDLQYLKLRVVNIKLETGENRITHHQFTTRPDKYRKFKWNLSSKMGNRMLIQNTKTKTTNTKLHSTKEK